MKASALFLTLSVTLFLATTSANNSDLDKAQEALREAHKQIKILQKSANKIIDNIQSSQCTPQKIESILNILKLIGVNAYSFDLSAPKMSTNLFYIDLNSNSTLTNKTPIKNIRIGIRTHHNFDENKKYPVIFIASGS
jgi:hypothetical protein